MANPALFVENCLKSFIVHGIVILSQLFSVQCLTVDVTPQEATIHEGDSITLQCQATYVAANGAISFTWFHHDGEVLATGGMVANTAKHHVTMVNGDTSILRVTNSDRDDAGPYTCIAMDGRNGDNARSSADITVLYKPAAHFPQCFVKNAIFQSLTDIQPGTRITMVCSSDVASPLPTISWYRSDKEQGDFISGEIIVGETFMRNEMTVTIGEEHQGATFDCHLQSPAFPSVDQTCALGPVSVLLGGTNSASEVTTRRSLYTDNGKHGNAKESVDVPTPSSTDSAPGVSTCKTSRFSLAARAMVPTTIILALLLIVSVIFNCLQMSKMSRITSKTARMPVARHQVGAELDGYMGINLDHRRPSQYTELNLTMRDISFEDNASDYYGYTMPGFKSKYEDMSSGQSGHDDSDNRRLSTVSKATYEDMDETGNPLTLASRPTSTMSRTTYEELADAHTPSTFMKRESTRTKAMSRVDCVDANTTRSSHVENHENEEYPIEPSISGTLDYHSYERAISSLSGQLDNP